MSSEDSESLFGSPCFVPYGGHPTEYTRDAPSGCEFLRSTPPCLGLIRGYGVYTICIQVLVSEITADLSHELTSSSVVYGILGRFLDGLSPVYRRFGELQRVHLRLHIGSVATSKLERNVAGLFAC